MVGSVIAGALGVGGALIGADAQDDASKRAARLERQRLALLMPYVNAGTRGLEQFEANIGQQPNFADILAGIEQDPGYQFQLEQGMNAIEGSAAARNNLLSGRTLRGLTEFGQQLGTGYADQAYNRELGAFQNRQNQLLTLMQGGQSAAGAPSQLPALALAGGQAQAAGITGATNALTGTLSNLYLANLLKAPQGTYGGFTPTPAANLAIPSMNMSAYGG